MNDIPENINQQLISLIENAIISTFQKKVDSECEFLKEYQAILNKRSLDTSKREGAIFDLLSKHHNQKSKDDLFQKFPNLEDEWMKLFDGFESVVKESQSKERFGAQENDRSLLRVLKFFKNFAFNISNAPTHFLNVFRKDKKAIDYWSHEIPVKNLAKLHLKIGLLKSIAEGENKLTKSFAAAYVVLKNAAEEGKEIKSLKGEIAVVTEAIESLRSGFENIAQEIAAKHVEGFNADYPIVGTIEYNNSRLTDSSIESLFSSAVKIYTRQTESWENTIYGLFDEWRTDLELEILRSKVEGLLNEYDLDLTAKQAEDIDPYLKAIEGFIKDIDAGITSHKDELKKELVRCRYKVTKELDQKMIPELCDNLASKNISGLVSKLENDLNQYVEELSDIRAIVKTDTYDEPLSNSDLYPLSLKDIISFEMLPKLEGQLDEAKNRIFNLLNEVNGHASDLDQIVIFTLTSAIDSIDDGEAKDEDINLVVKEGLTRALERTDDIRSKLKVSFEEINNIITSSVQTFLEAAMRLKDTDNAIEVRVRLTKAKALVQSEEYKAEMKDMASRVFKRTVDSIQNAYKTAVGNWNVFSQKFILTAKQKTISKEVSDFLNESKAAVERLPMIYRRLYRIEPLEDQDLFVGRDEEIEQIEQAYQAWCEGKYAATVVTGEKWGGNTSFLNAIEQKVKFKETILRQAAFGNFYDDESLLKLLSEILKNTEFKSFDEVVEFLNAGNARRVIIIEDLQKIYLRTVDGFLALKRLFELISLTGKNVFWVCSANIYSWHYLSKVIKINEYFSYIVELKPLNNEQIIEAILRRNRISGYKVQFQPGEEMQKNKKYLKMNDEQRQQHLKQVFFSNLSSYSKSNVSLALTYWLLSTQDVDKNTITVGAFSKPDLSFVTILSADKIFVLCALILHDGLDARQLSEVLQEDLHDTNLMMLMLLEDGIVQRKNDIYLVNQLVYRNIIDLLRSRNLIH
ncbi:MAG: hypothetical protein RJQ09_21680 [Cyclobacteriaceae bacterium]